MKKFWKATVAMVLSLVMLFSYADSASAKTSYNYNSGYKQYVTCTLQNRSKPGYVRIKTYNSGFRFGYTLRNNVRMTDAKGRVIWQEKGAIAMNGSRTFYLGNDHPVYRIYVSSYYGNGSVNFSNYGNVSIR
ncbi:MAG: hypothetical protein Q4B50_02755 [Bacillota bacterium]|nr:hypothetical protein [Bacillota bacterium]